MTATSSVALVGPVPGEAVEEQAAERIDVRPWIELLPLELLRSGVVRRAEERACPGQRGGGHELGDPEVGEVDVLRVVASGSARDEHVPGLHVPVEEPALVGRVERRGDLLHQPHDALRLERALSVEDLAQVAALDPPHRDEEEALGLALLVHRDDVRVVDQRGQPGLALEALAEALVGDKRAREHLQRNRAPEPQVLRPVHHPHPATAGKRLDAVPGELAADLEVTPHRPAVVPSRPPGRAPDRFPIYLQQWMRHGT